MKRDIDKLADRLVERGREGIVAEKKMLEWKIAEKKEQPASKTKAGSLPTLTIVARPNGSGKTTLTKWVREEFQDNPVLDPDAIANSLQTTGATKGSAIDAGREVLLKAERLIADRQSLTVETTLSGHTYLRMMTKAKLLGYFVVLIYIATRDVESTSREFETV